MPKYTDLYVVKSIESEFFNSFNNASSKMMGEVIKKKVITSLNIKGIYDKLTVNNIVEIIPYLKNLKLLNIENNHIGNMFVNDIL